MEYNEALLNALIHETNFQKSNGTFEWISEWLGYLPFGQYQWLEINNKDISEIKFDDDKEVIKYKINLPECL